MHFRNQVVLLIVTDNDIYRAILHQFIRARLNITAGSHNDSVRIQAAGTMNHLSGLAVCNIRYRTGIDEIEICFFSEGNDRISVLFQEFLHGLCLVFIYFTAQIMECCSFHLFTSFRIFET